MGTGSDYGSFMQHLGIACMDLTMMSVNSSYEGVYHSIYDDYFHMVSFEDLNFLWHQKMAQVWGSIVLRLADAPILPISYVDYSSYLQSAMYQLQALDTQGQFNASFDSIYSSLQTMIGNANSLDALAISPSIARALASDSLHLRMLNDQLYLAERCLCYWQGFAGRTWYRHVVWVDDLYDGYGSVAFSAINDAMNLHKWDEAGKQLALANFVIDQAADCLLPPGWLTGLRDKQMRQGTYEAYSEPVAFPASHLKTKDKSVNMPRRHRQFR